MKVQFHELATYSKEPGPIELSTGSQHDGGIYLGLDDTDLLLKLPELLQVFQLLFELEQNWSCEKKEQQQNISDFPNGGDLGSI